ncbi:MAG: anti-sigma factor [Cyanobacteria bacterium J06627_32]
MTQLTSANLPSEEALLLASGYVLEDLTAEEATRLEALLAKEPALLREIHALQTSYALLPQALETVEAPASLREKILATASATVDSSGASLAGSSATPSVGPVSDPSFSLPGVSSEKRNGQMGINWLVGLAGLVALLLLADNFRLRHQLRLAQESGPAELAADILQQPGSRLVSLSGADADSDAAGTLLFTAGRWQEVVVSFQDLPPLPPEEIYEMWLGLENGDVLYCGEFNTRSDGSVFVRFTPPETPPDGIKTTDLYVTINERDAAPDPTGKLVMEGSI